MRVAKLLASTPMTQTQHSATALLLPLTDVQALAAAGLGWPRTPQAWRWLYRRREERGLQEAFCTVGRRVLVNVPRFIELVTQQTGGAGRAA